jgi:hypothetical protein
VVWFHDSRLDGSPAINLFFTAHIHIITLTYQVLSPLTLQQDYLNVQSISDCTSHVIDTFPGLQRTFLESWCQLAAIDCFSKSSAKLRSVLFIGKKGIILQKVIVYTVQIENI